MSQTVHSSQKYLSRLPFPWRATIRRNMQRQWTYDKATVARVFLGLALLYVIGWATDTVSVPFLSTETLGVWIAQLIVAVPLSYWFGWRRKKGDWHYLSIVFLKVIGWLALYHILLIGARQLRR